MREQDKIVTDRLLGLETDEMRRDALLDEALQPHSVVREAAFVGLLVVGALVIRAYFPEEMNLAIVLGLAMAVAYPLGETRRVNRRINALIKMIQIDRRHARESREQ